MPTLALLAWPVLTVIVFVMTRAPVAVLASIIGGYLLLPPGFAIDVPLLPPFNKYNVAALAALACAFLLLSGRQDARTPLGWLPKAWIIYVLLLCILGGFLVTTLQNDDTQIFGTRIARAMTLYDGFSGILASLMLLIPFFLGRKYLATPEAQRTALIALMLAGFAYSFLALFEVRMSPQLNRWVYGYFPHSWAQHRRGDGFRPVVFLSHGLWLSVFFTMCYLAALGCTRVLKGVWRSIAYFITFWLFMTLVLSKSLGALMIAVVLTPFVLFLTKRMQFIAAGIIAMVVLTYPMLRTFDLVPLDPVIEFAESIDEKRAGSLEFRRHNEDVLLAHAMQRPLFGWGGNGRWLVHDTERNRTAVPDGYWVILFGSKGWVGYIGEFGLLVLPILLLAIRSRKIDFGPETSILMLVLIANLLDLLPNASMVPITWLLAGAAWGRLEVGAISSDQSVTDTSVTQPPEKTYIREHGPLPTQTPKPSLQSKGQDGPVYSRFPKSAKL